MDEGFSPETNFGLSIRERRMALGLSQRTFAAMVGASAAAVSRWENGKPPYGVVRKVILETLGELELPTEVVRPIQVSLTFAPTVMIGGTGQGSSELAEMMEGFFRLADRLSRGVRIDDALDDLKTRFAALEAPSRRKK